MTTSRPAPGDRRAGATSARILVLAEPGADPDALARSLSTRWCHAYAAPAGADVIDTIKRQPPDLVLIDAGTGGTHAIDLITRVRSLHRAADLPIVLATPADSRDLVLEAFAAGANDHVAKPIDIELLRARIAVQVSVRAELRRTAAARGRLQRRLESRARLEALGFGDQQLRLSVMNELHQDIAGGRVSLYYQPQYRIRPGTIESAEVLMRWHSQSIGPVSPSRFIPLAEETGDIAALTHWVIERALADRARLAEAGRRVQFAVNLSAVLADDDDFIDALLARLAANPGAISLELTESAIFDNPERAIINLGRFADAGVRIAIDDYGTGMSSLSYIQRLPVRELKIDRLFITRLTSSHRDPLLVRSTIEPAHALELEVVAEGVEDAETLALLSVMGCDIVQGYFVGRPMNLDEFMGFLGDQDQWAKLGAPFDARSFLGNILDARRAAG